MEISAELEKHKVMHIVWCWNGRIDSLNRGRTRLVSLVFEEDKTEFKQTRRILPAQVKEDFLSYVTI